MLSQQERQEIREEVWADMVQIEDEIAHRAGTFTHLVLLMGMPTFAHSACGPVLRCISHPEVA